MLNFHGMLTAPAQYDYEVSMRRKPTTNAVQNARLKIAYVRATDEAEAKRIAEQKNPAFLAGITRRKS